jgi:hypothetical protein
MSLCEALHGGGHGRSWSSINDGMGAHQRGEGEEGQGGSLGEGAPRGACHGGEGMGGGAMGLLFLVAVLC